MLQITEATLGHLKTWEGLNLNSRSPWINTSGILRDQVTISKICSIRVMMQWWKMESFSAKRSTKTALTFWAHYAKIHKYPSTCLVAHTLLDMPVRKTETKIKLGIKLARKEITSHCKHFLAVLMIKSHLNRWTIVRLLAARQKKRSKHWRSLFKCQTAIAGLPKMSYSSISWLIFSRSKIQRSRSQRRVISSCRELCTQLWHFWVIIKAVMIQTTTTFC